MSRPLYAVRFRARAVYLFSCGISRTKFSLGNRYLKYLEVAAVLDPKLLVLLDSDFLGKILRARAKPRQKSHTPSYSCKELRQSAAAPEVRLQAQFCHDATPQAGSQVSGIRRSSTPMPSADREDGRGRAPPPCGRSIDIDFLLHLLRQQRPR